MAIEYVKEIDDFIPIKTVFATATDKSGLVGNERKDGTSTSICKRSKTKNYGRT